VQLKPSHGGKVLRVICRAGFASSVHILENIFRTRFEWTVTVGGKAVVERGLYFGNKISLAS